jgi:LacI family transcriptional regulator
MTIRMKDIAKDLGISQATVSKVLREHPDIGEETRRRVLERVKELDYQPNSLARSLVTGRSYLIGLVAPSLLHPFFAQIAKSLSNEIRDKGYSLIVSSSEEDPELEREEISRLLARRLDALVVASSGANIEQFQRMDSKAQPYVLIDRDLTGLAANFVGINEGYRRALQHHGIPYSEDFVVRSDHTDTDTTSQGAQAMRLLLERDPKPDGVFCFNDPLAIGAMSTILGSGLRIPEDIALIGCGNLPNNPWLQIPLSSIDQHSQMIGQRAAELVLSLIESKQTPRARTIILEPTLVVRASTQRK